MIMLPFRAMPDRSRNRPRDVNELAKQLVDEATGEAPPAPDPDEGKDPAAVSLGRRGGLKGGKARAAKLSAKRRSEIARKLRRLVGSPSLHPQPSSSTASTLITRGKRG
jgi:hypothetical protein